MALCVSGPEWRGLAGGTIAYFGPMVDTSTCFKCRCTARLNFARGERLEASAKAACAPERSGRATTSFSASFRNAPAGKQRWPGNREDHGDDQGCQPRHMIGESRPKRGFRRAEHGQADARPFGITGGARKSPDWKIGQHPGFVGAPIFPEPGQVTPAAMIRDGEPRLMDSAALGTELGAGPTIRECVHSGPCSTRAICRIPGPQPDPRTASFWLEIVEKVLTNKCKFELSALRS
jgi:hypothetical protein